MQRAMTGKVLIITLLVAIVTAPPLSAEESKEADGTIFTMWPLIDYRESPREGYSNLSILGPLLKFQHRGDDRDIAVRPFYFGTDNQRNGTAAADYIYPLASSDSSPEATNVQVLELYQKNIYRKDEGEKKEKGTMLFPFYISGESKKYGPYTAFVPFLRRSLRAILEGRVPFRHVSPLWQDGEKRDHQPQLPLPDIFHNGRG